MRMKTCRPTRLVLAVALGIVLSSDAVAAQETAHDHSAMKQDRPKAGRDHSAMEADRSKAGHDHSEMKHDRPQAEHDHSKMQHGQSDTEHDHSAMQDEHAAMGHAMPATEPREPVPALTDADRRAAFPDVAGHSVHDNAVHSYFLLDRLEAWDAEPGTGMAWEGQGWIGRDLDRLWLRSEGERHRGATESASLEALYGRSVSPWWDVVAGVRHDFAPGASQSFVAVGVQGLAPQWFEVEATAYLGEGGQTAARLEVEYELLLTNRLILQPQLEVAFFGKDDPARGVGSGLGTAEAGLRLRYEFTRRFAPYVGIVHERAFGDTADLRRAESEDVDGTRVVAGVRIWF